MTEETATIEQPTEAAPQVQQPEAAPADAQAEGQADAQATDQQTEAGDKPRDDKGRFKGVQSRIDELTRAKYEAEREAAYWRGRASGGTAQDQAQPSAPQAAQPKPTPEQFQDYATYVEALTDWKTDQKVSQALGQRDQAAAQRIERELQAERVSTWQQRQDAARKAMPDYDEVMASAPDTPLARHVQESILDSDSGPAIAYHFAKNPADLARINAMPPLAAARELGRLEARLSPAASPAAKPVSNAPAPIKPINAGNGSNTNPASMSMEQYVAMRAKQGARWAN